MTTAAPKEKTLSSLVLQLESICLNSHLTWLTNDPTSCSLWSNIIGYQYKTKQNKNRRLVADQISSGLIEYLVI